jgi:hypothetical protein
MLASLDECSSRRMSGRTDKALLSDDTAPEIEDVQVERWRAMSHAEKADLIVGLCQAADTLALAGIRQRHPTASERECFLRLAMLKLGRELACRVYPDAAALID